MGDPSLPLLHIVQSATWTGGVDPGVVAAALLVLIVAVAVIWAPRPFSIERLTRAPGVRAGMAVLVFFAILPSVVPYDHVIPGLHHDDSLAAAETHSTHCHITPGSCADAPVPAGPNQLIFSDPLIVTPALLAVLLAFSLPVLTGISIKPDTRPPLA